MADNSSPNSSYLLLNMVVGEVVKNGLQTIGVCRSLWIQREVKRQVDGREFVSELCLILEGKKIGSPALSLCHAKITHQDVDLYCSSGFEAKAVERLA